MKFEPYPYQQYCIDRIVNDPSVGLFVEMGLGKTVITLTAIKELRLNRWQVSKPLVIAPKTVAEATWTTEAAKWDHLKVLRVVPVLGSAVQRERALSQSADVYVINRENVPWLVEKYAPDWPFDMVVLDESSSFKNSQSKRFKALRKVRPRVKKLVELTGTPTSNGLEDLWAQVYLLDGGARLGRTLTAYRQQYFVPGRRNQAVIFDYKPKPGSFEAIQARVNDICVSLKAKDYLTLPAIMVQDVPVTLDSAAWKVYRQFERDMLLELDESMITAQSAAVLTNKLLQMCNGAIYDEAGKVIEIHDCKLRAFLELLEQLHGEHVLVFYNFKHDLERLTAVLADTGLRVRTYTSADDAEVWNRGEVDVLLAQPMSCGYGLNLQYGGRHIIWYGLTWSLEQYEQANKRLHRQGQGKPVIVHNLIVQGGTDENVISALRGKSDVQSALMDALKVRVRTLKQKGE